MECAELQKLYNANVYLPYISFFFRVFIVYYNDALIINETFKSDVALSKKKKKNSAKNIMDEKYIHKSLINSSFFFEGSRLVGAGTERNSITFVRRIGVTISASPMSESSNSWVNNESSN